MQRVRAHVRVHLAHGAEANEGNPFLEELEAQRVNGRVRVRCEQHLLPRRHESAHCLRDEGRLARSGHTEHKTVVLACQHATHRASLLCVERRVRQALAFGRWQRLQRRRL